LPQCAHESHRLNFAPLASKSALTQTQHSSAIDSAWRATERTLVSGRIAVRLRQLPVPGSASSRTHADRQSGFNFGCWASWSRCCLAQLELLQAATAFCSLDRSRLRAAIALRLPRATKSTTLRPWTTRRQGSGSWRRNAGRGPSGNRARPEVPSKCRRCVAASARTGKLGQRTTVSGIGRPVSPAYYCLNA